MNRFFILFIVFLGLQSCQKEETGFGDTYSDEVLTHTIDLEKTDNLVFDSSAATIQFSIGANYWWNLTTEFVHQEGEYESDWLTIESGDSGFAGAGITARLTRNIDLQDRVVNLILSSQSDPNVSRSIPLTQKASEPFIEIDIDTKSVHILEYQFDIRLSAAGEWTASMPEWITLSKINGGSTLDEVIGVDVAQNASGKDRCGEIEFVNRHDPTVRRSVKIEQAGVFEAPAIEVRNEEDFMVRFTTDPATLYYRIIVYGDDQNTEITSVKLTDFDADTSYDLSTLDYGGYVGPIYVAVAAHLSDEVLSLSNKVKAHSHFDTASGDGSPEHPNIISTRRHFCNMAQALDQSYLQNADLDFSGVQNLMPIGNVDDMFSGIYDGGGKEILHLALASQNATIPPSLFGYVSGTIRNVYARECSNSVTATVPSQTGAAILVASLRGGTVENCTIQDCTMTANGNKIMGGIVGYNVGGRVVGCTAHGGYLTSTGVMFGGGIVGVNGVEGAQEESVVESCENVSMSLYGSNYTLNIDVGGIAYQNHHTIRNCINRANVSGSRYVGGISSGSNTVATAASNTIRYVGCANYGALEHYPRSGNGFCGGIVARILSTSETDGAIIDRCANLGTITIRSLTTMGSSFVGGIVGRLSRARLYNSFSRSVIDNQTGKSTPTIGGLMSDTNMATVIVDVQDCYSVLEVKNPTAKTGAVVGGAYNSAMDFSSVYYLSTYIYPQLVGTALSELEMKTQNSYVGWDFDTIWQMGESGYPELRD